MYVTRKAWNIVRRLINQYGAESLKKRLWNVDYSRGRYGYMVSVPGSTVGDFLYPFLVEHARKGSILDLGCGTGKTENELDREAYTEFVGVDISEVAIAKAKAWTERSGRGGKNRFCCSGFESFVPTQQFDVILFRESLYYVPLTKIKRTLDRYSAFLKEGGCFVVRLSEGMSRHAPVLEVIEASFGIIAKRFREDGAAVIVFRPPRRG
jgi:SAM-dependent methyltransferase